MLRFKNSIASAAARSFSVTIDAAVSANQGNGYSTTLKPQFLTGNWNAAKDIGGTSVLADLADNSQRIIIFGGNAYTGTGTHAITFSLSGSDKFDGDKTKIYISGNGDNIYLSLIHI